jgi:hypothetical protein
MSSDLDSWVSAVSAERSGCHLPLRADAEAGEILADFPEGLDCLITGVGTGGHITGVAEVLKPVMPRLKSSPSSR